MWEHLYIAALLGVLAISGNQASEHFASKTCKAGPIATLMTDC
jgi:hypothetical protein